MSGIVYLFKCGFGPKGCSLACIGPMRESSTTRMMYSLMLLVISVLQVCCHKDVLFSYVARTHNATFNSTCVYMRAGPECHRLTGYKGIYRIAYSFSIFHLIMALLCIRIYTSRSWRARIHNGFWIFKFLTIIGFWAILYLIPVFEEIIYYKTIMGMICAFIFIIIQHVCLIDCAYEFNGYLRSKGSGNCCFNVLIYLSAVFLYAATVGSYTLIYLEFAIPDYCQVNRWVIISNASASSILVLFSFCVKKYNECKLYIPGGVTCLFVVFITWTAISSAPNDMIPVKKAINNTSSFNCKGQSNFFRYYVNENMHRYLGIAVMLVTAVYSSVNSTIDSKRLGVKPSQSKIKQMSQSNVQHEDIEIKELKKKPMDNIPDSSASVVTSISNVNIPRDEQITVDKVRISEIKIEKQKSDGMNNEFCGSNSVFYKNDIPEINSSNSIKDKTYGKIKEALTDDLQTYDEYLIHDECNAVRYSYSWLHVIFALAYLFVMVQLTDWYSPETSNIQKFSGTWPSMLMKIVTSWVALLLFGWTLLCPVFCVGRKLYEYPIDSMKRLTKSIKHATKSS